VWVQICCLVRSVREARILPQLSLHARIASEDPVATESEMHPPFGSSAEWEKAIDTVRLCAAGRLQKGHQGGKACSFGGK
jgi:hypothetical protein